MPTLQEKLARIKALNRGQLPQKVPDPEPEPVIEEAEGEQLPPPVVNDENLPALQFPTKPFRPSVPIKLNNVPLPMLSDEEDVPLESCKGALSPEAITEFAPFKAVTRYCYKYAPKALMQDLASAHFDGDKIYRRDWKLFYLQVEGYGLHTFVSADQLQILLDDLNATVIDKLNEDNPNSNYAHLKLTEWDREGGLLVDFEDLPLALRPRQLGLCTSRQQFTSWTQQIQQEPSMSLPTDGDRSLEAFKAKMELVLEASRNKTRAQKARKQGQILLQRQDMVKQSLRAHCYLGLRAKIDPDALVPDISSLNVAPIDHDQPAPHPFDKEPIFIAIDVEAYEKGSRPVTEVGVATLDTRDLIGSAPGRVGENWHHMIRARHFRIIEYKHLVNSEYVQGCPDAFEFGQSEFVPQKSIGAVLASCFKEPFSGYSKTVTGSTYSAGEMRNIIVVGHDLGADVNYCRQVGFDIFNRGNIIDTADSATMYRAYTKDPNARSLGTIINDFDLTGWNLHNAGNDAVYTLRAMLAIAVQSASERHTEEEKQKIQEHKAARAEKYVEEAKERIENSYAGWDYSSSDDGGVAIAPAAADFLPKSKVAGEASKRVQSEPRAAAVADSEKPLDAQLYTYPAGNILDV